MLRTILTVKLFWILLQTGVAYSVPTVDVLAPSGSSSDPHTQKLWELSVKQLHVSSAIHLPCFSTLFIILREGRAVIFFLDHEIKCKFNLSLLISNPKCALKSIHMWGKIHFNQIISG